jgi:hypothetical protein
MTGPDAVTFSWRTSTSASSVVEIGTTEPSRTIVGNTNLSTAHTVAVPGLQAGADYVFRVRSSDSLRRVSLSPLATFKAGLAMTPLPVSDATYFGKSATVPVILSWSHGTTPSGVPVTFELQVDDSPVFDSPVVSTTLTTRSITVSLPNGGSWSWRVRARFTVATEWSPWSATTQFSTASPVN